MEYSLYQQTTIDEMPSRVWKKIVGQETEEAARVARIKNLRQLLDTKDYNDVLRFLSTEGNKCTSIEEGKRFERAANLISVQYALETSFEFVVDPGNKAMAGITSLEFLKTFDMPFEGMLINFKQENKYLSSFISCVELADRYFKDGKAYKVYVLKECAVKKIDGKWRYGILSEFSFIPELAPRIYVECKGAERGCPHHVKTRIHESMGVKDVTGIMQQLNRPICLKTPRTIDLCPDDIIYSSNRKMYPIIMVVENVLNIIKHRRTVRRDVSERVGRINSSPTNRRDANGNNADRFVDLTKPIERYEGGTGEGTKHSEHKSPKQHLRQGFMRHLKSGRVVYVRETMVNGDNKDKVTYKI